MAYNSALEKRGIAALLEVRFGLIGEPAKYAIDLIDDYFFTLDQNEDISVAVSRRCLEKALDERLPERLETTIDRAREYALSTR